MISASASPVMPSPMPPRCARRLRLLRQREARDVVDVVEHPHRNLGDRASVQRRRAAPGRERRADEAREVERAEVARAVRRQRDLAAGIGRVDALGVARGCPARVDAIDEDDAGLRAFVGGADDASPAARGRARCRVTCRAAPSAGNASGQSASASAARRKSSLTSTDRLKCVSCPRCRFAATNASMSG